MRFAFLIFAFIFSCGVSGAAQDLGQLPGRVSKLWELRKERNRLDALQLIDPETRRIYLSWDDTPINSFKVSELKFTDDSNRINVVVVVHFTLPGVGEIDRTVQDPWVWNDGQWFMVASPVADLFEENKPAETVRTAPQFTVENAAINLGRHAQGETLSGKISFRADRKRVVVIRPVSVASGLVIGPPIWTGPLEGYLSYSWITTLISKDIDEPVKFEARDLDGETASAEVRFRGQIEGKVAFSQTPEVWDTGQSEKAEVQIRNLTPRTLKVLSAVSRNRAFTVDDDVPPSIEPGKSGRILIHYNAVTEPSAVSIAVVLSEALGPTAITIVPLNIKLPQENQSSTPTREQLDRLLKGFPVPSLPTH